MRLAYALIIVVIATWSGPGGGLLKEGAAAELSRSAKGESPQDTAEQADRGTQVIGSRLLRPAARADSGAPNVLLITSEDNGPELACYGDRYARTPNLDRLAAQGVRFERAFVTTASCSASRPA